MDQHTLFGPMPPRATSLRPYGDELTVDINTKGVLDVDVVKGCTSGIAAHGPTGCYHACYAASIAKFRGIDFSRSVVRRVKTKQQARLIERAIKAAPLGFFRIGTMGDPCHAWRVTVETVEWLAPFAVPVIITKHWKRLTDEQIKRLIACGTILNTSVSAIDTPKHLARREAEIRRYAYFGGTSVARVVSCDFNTEHADGRRMAEIQARLISLRPIIDNPLRIPATHELVTSGIVRIRKVKDLTAIRTISMPNDSTTYVGHCQGCSDLCGLGLVEGPIVRRESKQTELGI